MIIKYLIPFYDINTNSFYNPKEIKCHQCEKINNYIEEILINQQKLANINTYTEENIKQIIKLIQDIINNLERYLVDGYNLASLFNKLYTLYSRDVLNGDEANRAFKDKFLNEYNQMKNYDILVNNRIYYYLNHLLIYNKKYQDLIISNNEEELFNKFYINELTHNNFSNDATTTYGRWCSLCGSRKLDIYDCIRNYSNTTNHYINNKNNNNLLIKNLYCELVDNKLYIIWQDVNIDTYKYTLLFINNTLISKYTYNEHITTPVEVNISKFSNINIYKICVINYDVFDEQIAKSSTQYVINNDYRDFTNIRVNDLQVQQETILVPRSLILENDANFYESEILLDQNNNTTNNDDVHGSANSSITNNINDEINIVDDIFINTNRNKFIHKNTDSNLIPSTDITITLDNLHDYYILNVLCISENDILYITWQDVRNCYQSKIFINSILINTYEYNAHVKIPAEVDTNQLTKSDAYTINIVNYDRQGKEIAHKLVRYNKKTQVLNDNPNINMQMYIVDDDVNHYAMPNGLTDFSKNQLAKVNRPTIIDSQIVYTHLNPVAQVGMNISKYELDQLTDNKFENSSDNNSFYNDISEKLLQDVPYKSNNIDLNEYKSDIKDNISNIQVNEFDSVYKPSFLHKNTSDWVRKKVLAINYTSRSDKNVLKRSLQAFPRDIYFDFTCLPLNINNHLYQIFNDLDVSIWYMKIFPISNYIKAQLTDSNCINNSYRIWQDININSSKVAYQLQPLTFECIQLKCRNLSQRVELTWVDPYVNWKKTLIYIKEYDGKLVSYKLI